MPKGTRPWALLGLGASMAVVFGGCLLTQLPYSSYFSPIPASHEATDNRIGQPSEMQTALPEEPSLLGEISGESWYLIRRSQKREKEAKEQEKIGKGSETWLRNAACRLPK